MARIHSDITSAVGDTPLVRLNALTEGLGGEVLVKLEFYNPGSSVKDRLGIALVDAAEASGELQPGGTIVESTSGNTGIALALFGAARGYRVILTMPASMSKERRTLLKAYGAELVLTDPYKGMTEAVQTAERIAAETPGAVLAHQFEQPRERRDPPPHDRGGDLARHRRPRRLLRRRIGDRRHDHGRRTACSSSATPT